MDKAIFAIGHSTRSIEEFISLLKENGVELLVDIRTIPKSRHNPQFNTDSLRDSMEAAGLKYEHDAALGGLRHTTKKSINMGWRNESFRGYADYMQTEEFKKALVDLVARSQKYTLAIMCAEAVPWRCHRSLVADALLARGVKVMHIMGVGKISPHKLTSFAKVEGERVWYPAIDPTLF